MAIPPIVAIEIGTTRTVALVGEMRDDGKIIISGQGQYPSTGVRKGEVVDLQNAKIGVQAALEQAEESSQVSIRQAHVAVSGGHIEAVTNRGSVPVLGRDRVIIREDVDEVMELAKVVSLPQDREVLHTICQEFCIDNHARVVKPEGMEGSRLTVEMLVVHGVRARMHGTVNVLQDVPLEVQDVAFGGLCAGLAVLTPEQKRSGAVVIDLGGGTTDYLVYAGNILAAAGSIGIGGDHITNDIALGFNIPITRAEKIKCEHGAAFIQDEIGDQRVSLPREVGFPERSISLKALQTVVNARMDETLRMVREQLHEERLLHHIASGVIITGGGAYLRGLPELASRVFGLPCSIGTPRGIQGLDAAENPAAFATACGLVLYGFKTYQDSSMLTPIRNWIKGVFRR